MKPFIHVLLFVAFLISPQAFAFECNDNNLDATTVKEALLAAQDEALKEAEQLPKTLDGHYDFCQNVPSSFGEKTILFEKVIVQTNEFLIASKQHCSNNHKELREVAKDAVSQLDDINEAMYTTFSICEE